MNDYLEQLKNVYQIATRSGQSTPELSYRPVLDSFFRSLPTILGIGTVDVIYEPVKQQKSGRPDWRFHHSQSMGIFGYVEAKGLEKKSTTKWQNHSVQLNKYLSIGHKVILTDGVDFLFFSPKNPDTPLILSLLKKPYKVSSTKIPGIIPKLKSAFLEFFRQPAARTINDDELMIELATRSKNLEEDILELVSLNLGEGMDDLENKAIKALKDLKKVLEIEHDPELRTDERFSKTVSQVLIFGLFYAHRQLSGSVHDSDKMRASIHNFWLAPITMSGENKLRPFRALADVLETGSGELTGLNLWYSDCILLLSYIKLSATQQKSPNYHELYEKFLTHFDPKDRIDFGAYATPSSLAKFMLFFSEQVSKKYFDESIFQTKNKIIEPCCGTGTFIEELLRFAFNMRLQKENLPTIAGFEILAAPYALSQYRLIQLQSVGIPHASEIKIILCNTLSDHVTRNLMTSKNGKEKESPIVATNLLREEISEASKLANPPITLIIGNPPSSDAGLHTDEKLSKTILSLIDDFRPPLQQRTNRQNVQKQIQNDFVKFLRWACYKLETNKPGILAFILPDSFLQHISYAFARKWLTENFSNIWVIELDADGRTGVPTSNIFNTLQGRCLIFCERKNSENKTGSIKYFSLVKLSRSQKIQFLEDYVVSLKNSKQFDEFFEVMTIPNDGHYGFKPKSSFDASMYSKFWPLTISESVPESKENYIFARHSSGVKLGVTSAFVHPETELLSRKVRDLSNSSIDYNSLIDKWFSGQSKPPREQNLSPKIRRSIYNIMKNGRGHLNYLKRYSFRPFMNFYAFLSEPVFRELSSEGGGGTRYRPEVIAAFEEQNNFGISVAPSPVDLGNQIQRFVSFCWHVPDNDLCARGNGHIFCPKFPKYKSRPAWNSSTESNINKKLHNLLIQKGCNPKTVDDDIALYVYAVLTSNFYLDRFEGALFTTSGDWPRIPIPSDMGNFEKMCSIGRKLAYLEDNSKLIKFKNKQNILPVNGIKLKNYSVNESSGTIELKDYEGKSYLLTDLERNVLACQISGYNVFNEWIKRHTWPYLRKNFTNKAVNDLYLLSHRIKLQFDLIEQADNVLSNMLKTGAKSIISV
ncbi:MAG: N-6 DNA methylase [Thaumarchaeota archaeon]|nr:N-6 DNA methylase [Nitrososphaerota archaeon]